MAATVKDGATGESRLLTFADSDADEAVTESGPADGLPHSFGGLCAAADGTIYMLGGSPAEPAAVYSWQFGREVNNPWYGLRPENYAPWNEAKVVLFYPSIFDLRSPAAGPGNKSTVAMQHFASYVRGANGLDGVAP